MGYFDPPDDEFYSDTCLFCQAELSEALVSVGMFCCNEDHEQKYLDMVRKQEAEQDELMMREALVDFSGFSLRSYESEYHQEMASEAFADEAFDADRERRLRPRY
jgi:hypothetical protein